MVLEACVADNSLNETKNEKLMMNPIIMKPKFQYRCRRRKSDTKWNKKWNKNLKVDVEALGTIDLSESS